MEVAADAPDEALAQAGDASALVRRYYGPVFGLARRLLGPADARDVAQETFARALAALRRYDPSRSFRVWIFAIAANHIRDLLRRRRPVEPLPPDLEAGLDEQALVGPEDRARLGEAVDRLHPDLRLVVLLHFQQDLPPRDVADVLGITPNAARIRLYRALQALRKELL